MDFQGISVRLAYHQGNIWVALRIHYVIATDALRTDYGRTTDALRRDYGSIREGLGMECGGRVKQSAMFRRTSWQQRSRVQQQEQPAAEEAREWRQRNGSSHSPCRLCSVWRQMAKPAPSTEGRRALWSAAASRTRRRFGFRRRGFLKGGRSAPSQSGVAARRTRFATAVHMAVETIPLPPFPCFPFLCLLGW